MRALIPSLLLLALLPLSAQTKPPAVTPHPLSEADALGEHLYRDSGETGLILLIVRYNQVFFRGYGETAPGSGQPPTENSVLRLCSLTKTFTADVLSKLAADGTLKLDDPLQRYAPHDFTVPQRDKPITLLDLATHTAGLTREIGTPPRHTPHFTYPDYATRWQWLQTQQLLYSPGTAALYSNVGFDLLADALANAAHRPYAELLETRTLKPLHMDHTTFYPNSAQCAALLRGANDEGPCTPTEQTMGSSGLYSTAADIANYLKYLLGTGAPALPAQPDDAHAVYLVPAELVREGGLDHAGAPSGIGLAWMHLQPNDNPEHIIEKTGGGAGFLTYIAIHPASHTALFLAATDGPGGIGVPGFNLFKAANNALLQLAGLPPMQEEIQFHRRHARIVRTSHPRTAGRTLSNKQHPPRRHTPAKHHARTPRAH